MKIIIAEVFIYHKFVIIDYY